MTTIIAVFNDDSALARALTTIEVDSDHITVIGRDQVIAPGNQIADSATISGVGGAMEDAGGILGPKTLLTGDSAPAERDRRAQLRLILSNAGATEDELPSLVDAVQHGERVLILDVHTEQAVALRQTLASTGASTVLEPRL